METKKACVNSVKTSDYFSFMILPLQLSCFWEWFPNTNNPIHKIINIGYYIFSLSIIIQINISLYCQLFFHWTTIFGSADIIFNILAYSVCAYFILYFRIFQQDFYDLINHLEMNFRFHSARGFSNITMKPTCRSAKIFCTAYFINCVCGCVFVPVAAIFSEELPLKMWYPFDESQYGFHQIAYALQTFGQFTLGFVYGSICPLLTFNCILICGQIDLLSCSIRNTRFTSALRSGMPYSMLKKSDTTLAEDELCNYSSAQPEFIESHYHYDIYDRGVPAGKNDAQSDNSEEAADASTLHARRCITPNDVYSPMYDDGAVKALKECIIFHTMILDYIGKFKNFVAHIFFWRIFNIVGVMCFIMYSLSVKIEPTMVSYLVICLFDTFMYCYFGNDVTVQADKVTLALNQSLWQFSGLRYRKMVTLMLLANTKPVIITAGFFFDLTIETFLMVVKTSFSYYTMLQNVREN